METLVRVTSLREFEELNIRVDFSSENFCILSHFKTNRFWDHSQPSPCILVMEKHTEFVYGLDLSNHNENMLADCAWDQTVGVYNLGKLTPNP